MGGAPPPAPRQTNICVLLILYRATSVELSGVRGFGWSGTKTAREDKRNTSAPHPTDSSNGNNLLLLLLIIIVIIIIIMIIIIMIIITTAKTNENIPAPHLAIIIKTIMMIIVIMITVSITPLLLSLLVVLLLVLLILLILPLLSSGGPRPQSYPGTSHYY